MNDSQPRTSSFWRVARVVALVVILVHLAFFGFRSVAWDWYRLNSGAMEPTIHSGQHVLVFKAAYSVRLPFTPIRLSGTGRPARGDIVVFRNPDGGTRPFIMRIVALAGDTVGLTNEVLVLNGVQQPLELRPATRSSEGETTIVGQTRIASTTHDVLIHPDRPAYRSFPVMKVPLNEVFVLGDNRDRSRDSRFFRTIPVQSLLGRVVFAPNGA